MTLATSALALLPSAPADHPLPAAPAPILFAAVPNAEPDAIPESAVFAEVLDEEVRDSDTEGEAAHTQSILAAALIQPQTFPLLAGQDPTNLSHGQPGAEAGVHAVSMRPIIAAKSDGLIQALRALAGPEARIEVSVAGPSNSRIFQKPGDSAASSVTNESGREGPAPPAIAAFELAVRATAQPEEAAPSCAIAPPEAATAQRLPRGPMPPPLMPEVNQSEPDLIGSALAKAVGETHPELPGRERLADARATGAEDTPPAAAAVEMPQSPVVEPADSSAALPESGDRAVPATEMNSKGGNDGDNDSNSAGERPREGSASTRRQPPAFASPSREDNSQPLPAGDPGSFSSSVQRRGGASDLAPSPASRTAAAEPQTESPLATSLDRPAQVVREIRIQLPARDGGRIDLSFKDRGGEIQVRAHTQTQADAVPLRLNIDELRHGLGDRGFTTEMHLPALQSEPGAAPELPLRSNESAEPRPVVHEAGQAGSDLSNPSGDGGRGNRNAMGRWVDQLEDSIDGPALKRTGKEDSE